ncbi:MAG: hypothetical protein WCA14_03145, partial [Steroidobacteraceae bacterium]
MPALAGAPRCIPDWAMNVRGRLVCILAAVAALNLVAGAGVLSLGGFGVAGLGVGLIAYLLGVRHAF